MLRWASVACLVALPACGGGGGPTAVPAPSAPPTPTPGWPLGTAIALLNGETGAEVQGQFIIAGQPAQAGVPLATAAAPGATVDVTAPGFLVRQTIVRTGETTLVLWPDTAAFPGQYTRDLVYSQGKDGEIAPLRRFATSVKSVAVSLSSELQADPAAMEAHRAAVDAFNAAAAPLGVTYALGGAGQVSVTTKLDPEDENCGSMTRALTYRWLAGSEITQGQIVYCREDVARTAVTIAHELGHTFGLHHSSDRSDLMYGYYVPSRSNTPTPRELLTMSLMRRRRPGTEWPDNDRAAVGTTARRRETIVD